MAQFLKDELSNECESLLVDSKSNVKRVNLLDASCELSVHNDFDIRNTLEPEKNYNGFDETFINKIPEEGKSANSNLSWLRNDYEQYQNFLSGLSWEEFSKSLHQILSSEKSNDELQNELIEMLGFDLFELIIEILNKRRSILDSFNTGM